LVLNLKSEIQKIGRAKY
jgi:hypothetical protein